MHLLRQDDSLILKLTGEDGNSDTGCLPNRVEQAIEERTKVQGGQVYVGQDLNQCTDPCRG